MLERSGHKGYHLWIRFTEPVLCREARQWLLEVVVDAGPLPEGINVEIFPTRDKVTDSIGPLVKLPLGIHSKTGKRCPLIDDNGIPLADPFEMLRTMPRFTRMALESGLTGAQGKDANGSEKNKPSELGLRFGPKAVRMIEGCNVLRHLVEKADKASYLTHTERSLLRCTLGHLGDEGFAAIHEIISHCYNYKKEVTDRHMGKLPPSPISCPRIREIHPQITVAVGCDCRFRIAGKGYPTPVLHVLKPADIPGFHHRATKDSRPVDKTPESGGTGGEKLKEAEQMVLKISERKRQIRSLQTTIERMHNDLSQIFESLGVDHIELPMGMLRRVPREGGEGFDFRIEV